jgi:hypothetical protein
VLNVKLAERILRHAEKHPESVDLESWWVPGSHTRLGTPQGLKKPWKCGTTGCIAGWAIFFSGQAQFDEYGYIESIGDGIEDQARELLGLSEAQAGRMFYSFSTEDSLAQLQALVNEAKAA